MEELGIADGDVSWASELGRAQVSDVLAALRRVSHDLENRSIRRGALQALANAGTPEDVLLLFSGHTNVVTLRRYLGWGSIGTAKRTTMTTAAAALAPTGGRRHDPYCPSSTPGPPSYEDSVRHRTQPVPTLGREHERWLQFLGMEAPPLDALPVAAPLSNPDDLPLMSKDVAAAINMDLVRNIIAASPSPGLPPDLAQWSAAIPPELKSFASEAFGWLHNPAQYEKFNDI